MNNDVLDRYTKNYKIQILRGLAIIAVVCIHNCPDGLGHVWLRPFMNFGVGLFFFLSGFLSNIKNWNPMRRIIRVGIPYVIWTFIFIVIGSAQNPSAIPIEFVSGLILGNANVAMYFIPVYCQFTLLIPFIDKLARSKINYLGFLITPISIIIMRYIPVFSGFVYPKYILYIDSISCLEWFTYFYLGYLIGNQIIKVEISNRKLFILWLASILLQIGEGYLWYYWGEANCGSQLKLTSILSGICFCLLAYGYIINEQDANSKISQILKRIGDDSFGIYFVHLLIMIVLNNIYSYKFVLFPFNAIIVIVVSTLFVELGKKIFGRHSKLLGF